MELEPRRIVEVIESRLTSGTGLIGVYWYRVLGDRDQYAEELLRCRGQLPIVPLIVRGERFDNPNALLTDLVKLLEGYRILVEASLTSGEAPTTPALILLGRTSLALPQISSPAVLPDWFPVLGGQTVNIAIEDLTFRADGPVASPESRIEDLCELLFRIEQAMTRRMRRVAQTNQTAAAPFFAAIKRSGDTNLETFLIACTGFCDKVNNPRYFRPSVRDGASLVARLIGLVGSSTPEQMPAKGLALMQALEFDPSEFPVSESVAAVIFRPLTPEKDRVAAVGRSILISIFVTAQLITAAAHSDSYPRYPLTLLASLSRDLMTVMAQVEHAVFA